MPSSLQAMSHLQRKSRDGMDGGVWNQVEETEAESIDILEDVTEDIGCRTEHSLPHQTFAMQRRQTNQVMSRPCSDPVTTPVLTLQALSSTKSPAPRSHSSCEETSIQSSRSFPRLSSGEDTVAATSTANATLVMGKPKLASASQSSGGKSSLRAVLSQRRTPEDLVLEDLSKPILRGKIHLVLTFLSPLWIGLMLQPCITWTSYVASLISVFSSFTNFCASMLLHNFTWSPKWRVIMNKVDHAGIFMMISGSTTPIPMLLLETWSSVFLMVIQWGATMYGLVTIWFGDLSFTARRSRALTYVIVGLLHGIFITEYIRVLTNIEISLVLLLAFFYIVGAVVYACRWPDPFPNIFGFHEIFHACCLGSAICTFFVDYSVLSRAGGGGVTSVAATTGATEVDGPISGPF